MKINSKQINRFWNLVVKTDSCWLWSGNKNPKGYGRFGLNYRREYAHRVSYWITNGKIPKNLVIDHLCRNTSCVNPSHLEVVTTKENVLRGESIFSKQARQTHCSRGHGFTTDNTYLYGNHRKCKKCNVIQARIFRTRLLTN